MNIFACFMECVILLGYIKQMQSIVLELEIPTRQTILRIQCHSYGYVNIMNMKGKIYLTP